MEEGGGEKLFFRREIIIKCWLNDDDAEGLDNGRGDIWYGWHYINMKKKEECGTRVMKKKPQKRPISVTWTTTTTTSCSRVCDQLEM